MHTTYFNVVFLCARRTRYLKTTIDVVFSHFLQKKNHKRRRASAASSTRSAQTPRTPWQERYFLSIFSLIWSIRSYVTDRVVSNPFRNFFVYSYLKKNILLSSPIHEGGQPKGFSFDSMDANSRVWFPSFLRKPLKGVKGNNVFILCFF